jgi:predicted metal-binding membrane protein
MSSNSVLIHQDSRIFSKGIKCYLAIYILILVLGISKISIISLLDLFVFVDCQYTFGIFKLYL